MGVEHSKPFAAGDYPDYFADPLKPYVDEALRRKEKYAYRNAGALAYEVAQFYFEPNDAQFGKVRRKLETRLKPYF